MIPDGMTPERLKELREYYAPEWLSHSRLRELFNHIDQQAAEIDRLKAIIQQEAEDWAETDTAVRNVARKHFGEPADGTPDAVPSIIDLIEQMDIELTDTHDENTAHWQHIAELKAENERLTKIADAWGDWNAMNAYRDENIRLKAELAAKAIRWTDAKPTTPCLSIVINRPGDSLDIHLDTSRPCYSEWIEGEGGDIGLDRDRETNKVVGCSLPLLQKTVVISEIRKDDKDGFKAMISDPATKGQWSDKPIPQPEERT